MTSPMQEDKVEIDLTGLVLPEKVETAHSSEDGRIARFVVEPLERGYGHTLGNSVRRVLLSSLRGSAIWAFRVDGVVHEHQTISGVVEDVHQVIQNLKALVLTLDEETPEVILEVTADKAGPVRAGHIQDKAGVTVLDPEHHILTLQEDGPFRMELRVNKGRGFVLADQHSVEKGAPVDLVRIDAIYNPVRRANFEVSETRVGQRTDFDQLSLHVETDGSVSPEDAVAVAAELVRKHLSYLLYFGKEGLPQETPAGATPLPAEMAGLLEKTIEEVGELSVRSRNSLQKESIFTLGELVRRTESEMLKIENFGKKSLQEIEDFLATQNLRFGMQIESGNDGQLFLLDEAGAGQTAAPDED